MANTLRLNGLPLGTGVRNVLDACQEFGPVSRVTVESAGVWEEPVSVALVEFANQTDAEAARQVLQSRLAGNGRIVVD